MLEYVRINWIMNSLIFHHDKIIVSCFVTTINTSGVWCFLENIRMKGTFLIIFLIRIFFSGHLKVLKGDSPFSNRFFCVCLVWERKRKEK